MDWEGRCLRVCGAVILLAVLVRMTASGVLDPMVETIRDPKTAAFLVYLQTGRVVRMAAPEPSEPRNQERILPVFQEGDMELVGLTTSSDYSPDLESLLIKPLSFDLDASEPTVLILHTHATESYTKTQENDYVSSDPYRTLDENYNMVRIGQEVARILTDAGVAVIHDRTFHDYPDFNGAYTHSAEAAQAWVDRYPSIRLILDLHRDAADTDQGQLVTHATVNGQSSAQLMMVVGTDGGGRSHPNWQENLSLALKLQVVLEKKNPGICRDLSLSWQRYNQHFAPGALLVEVGAAGNTLEEALTAAEALADGIINLFGLG